MTPLPRRARPESDEPRPRTPEPAGDAAPSPARRGFVDAATAAVTGGAVVALRAASEPPTGEEPSVDEPSPEVPAGDGLPVEKDAAEHGKAAAVPASTGPRRMREGADDRPWWRKVLSVMVHRRPKYSVVRGDIEGLRAIAVVWVILFHLGVRPFGGGFAGVDVFFVISGFLITGQLLSMVRQHGRLDLLDFYSRRLRRLLPAATLVLVVTLLAGWWLLPASRWRLLSQDAALAAVYSLNWGLAARSVDYLGSSEQPTAVQHYWSLGVEEQFYLVWPLLIMGCLWLARRRRWSTTRAVTAGLGVLWLASLVHSVTWTASHPEPAYFSSFTRVWELASGAVVAILGPRLARWVGRRWRRWAALGSLLGLAMVVATAFVFSPRTAWPSAAALVPVLGTCLVILAGGVHQTKVARWLGNPVMVQLGMLSYSMYLWHWPVIVIWSSLSDGLGWAEKVGVFVVTVAASMVTLRLVEDPLRFSLKLQTRPTWVLGLSAALMAVTLTVAAVVHARVPQLTTVDVLGSDATQTSGGEPTASPSTVSGPLPVKGDYIGALALVFNSSVQGVPTVRPDLQAAITATKPVMPTAATALDDLPDVYQTHCEQPKSATAVWPDGRCLSGDSQGKLDVVLVGDSKMSQWKPALDVIGKRHGWRINTYAKSGCAFSASPQYPQCDTYNKALAARLMANPPKVLITSTYAFTAVGEGMVKLLQPLQAKGTKVVLLQDNPTPSIAVVECVNRTQSLERCEFPSNRGHGNQELELVAVQLKVETVTVSEWICPPGRATCPVTLGNVFIYRDTSHLTRTFVLSMAPILERKFAALGLAKGRVLPLQR